MKKMIALIPAALMLVACSSPNQVGAGLLSQQSVSQSVQTSAQTSNQTSTPSGQSRSSSSGQAAIGGGLLSPLNGSDATGAEMATRFAGEMNAGLDDAAESDYLGAGSEYDLGAYLNGGYADAGYDYSGYAGYDQGGYSSSSDSSGDAWAGTCGPNADYNEQLVCSGVPASMLP